MSSEHKWIYYLSPHDAWDAMYQDCVHATKSIDMEQYILENDSVGQRFLELFIEKAASGVNVFIVCDRYGSSSFFGSALVQKLQDHGGHFYFYNTISYWDIFRPWRWFPRTHIKTLLVDSTIAYTGGVCIADRMKDWRDTQIRITGPIVGKIRDAFGRAELVIRHKRVGKSPETSGWAKDFMYLQSNPLLSWHIIYTNLVRAIRLAEQYVYLTTPFFAPNRRFRRLLRDAPAKGVSVMLLVPEHSGDLLVDWVCLSYARKLLEAGVRIFMYEKSMIHCKTVVIDDHWATVGSTNMDIISFFRNREANLVTRNAVAVGELKQQFLADLKNCRELTLEQMPQVPFWKIAIGYMARSIRSFL